MAGGRSFVTVSMSKIKQDRAMGRSISRDTRCTHCRQDGAHKKCLCKQVRYCQEACQQAHWPSHKQECPYRKKTMGKNLVVDSDDKYAQMLAQKTGAMLKQGVLEKLGGTHTLMEQAELLVTTVGDMATTEV